MKQVDLTDLVKLLQRYQYPQTLSDPQLRCDLDKLSNGFSDFFMKYVDIYGRFYYEDLVSDFNKKIRK